jgi:hypothetical protein
MTPIRSNLSNPTSPQIFISHRHKDEEVVRAFVGVLESAFDLRSDDLRCTSLQPYDLKPGDKTSEKLRADIEGAKLVIGMIGPDTSESEYVLFELGASWGLGVPIFPLLIGKASHVHVPGPFKERHSVSLCEERDCHQLVDDIADKTTLKRRTRASGSISSAIKKLVELSDSYAPRTNVAPPQSLPEPTRHWRNLRGEVASDARPEASWVDLAHSREFSMGDRLRLILGEPLGAQRQPARKILVRFLCDGDDPSEPVGILVRQGFLVPEDGILDISVPESFSDVCCISIHGGENPWKKFPLGKDNGTPSFVRVATLEPAR